MILAVRIAGQIRRKTGRRQLHRKEDIASKDRGPRKPRKYAPPGNKVESAAPLGLGWGHARRDQGLAPLATIRRPSGAIQVPDGVTSSGGTSSGRWYKSRTVVQVPDGGTSSGRCMHRRYGSGGAAGPEGYTLPYGDRHMSARYTSAWFMSARYASKRYVLSRYPFGTIRVRAVITRGGQAASYFA